MSQETWTTVTLGDIAENISVRVDDPSKSGLDRFVGLEHLDSGSVTVSRWGSTSEFSSGKKFESGDVLLCRRRPYLRKCSATNFEGVCSGDAYVLREKDGAIAPGLLKYLLNSERFWDYCITNADGSMSSRVKWEALKQFQITLKNLEQQKKDMRILDLVSADKAIINCTYAANKTINKLLQLYLFDDNKKMKNPREIGHVGEVITGTTPSTKNAAYYGGNFLFFKPPDFSEANIYLDETTTKITQLGLDVCRKIPANTVMFTCIGTIGKTAITTTTCATNQQINSIICSNEVDPRYLYHVLTYLSKNIERMSSTSVVPMINKRDFSKLKIPILEYDVQLELIEKLDILVSSRQNLEFYVSAKKSLQKSIISKIMGDNDVQ